MEKDALDNETYIKIMVNELYEQFPDNKEDTNRVWDRFLYLAEIQIREKQDDD